MVQCGDWSWCLRGSIVQGWTWFQKEDIQIRAEQQIVSISLLKEKGSVIVLIFCSVEFTLDLLGTIYNHYDQAYATGQVDPISASIPSCSCSPENFFSSFLL